ncbi:FtsX-like permease family protein [Streptomyces sp900129855]|uniref:FtsX-like permease family protein n=1 Tax=Streptomyces sp. 900129855 TaxID=3155129 RepID=A0ABV2ZR68_9ACTN
MFTGGSGPKGAGQVALDKDTADKGGYHVGDTVPVALKGPARTYKLSGIFTTDDELVASGGSLVLFETPVAQRLFRQPGFYEYVTVTAAPGVSSTELAAASGKTLPDSAKAETGRQLVDEEAKTVEGDARLLNGILFAFAGVALLVSVFLIANTFTMLRAVGLDRRGVTRMIQLEAVVISLFGAVIGIAVGAFLGWAVCEVTKADIAG